MQTFLPRASAASPEVSAGNSPGDYSSPSRSSGAFYSRDRRDPLPVNSGAGAGRAAIKVLVGCEESGEVRRAFRSRGFDAWSLDMKPARDGSLFHITGDIRSHLGDGWDMAIIHPPCTRPTNAGVRWLDQPTQREAPEDATSAEKQSWRFMTIAQRRIVMHRLLAEGAALFSDCLNAPIPLLVVENPVMHRHAKAAIQGFRPFDQSVQPWHFADSEDSQDNVKKRTCFWIRGLPLLKRTGSVDGSTARPEIHHASPGADRAERRSKTFPGIAQAMAKQWGDHIMDHFTK